MFNAQPTASHFIDGTYVESIGPEIEVTYAYTGEVIAVLHEATPDLVDAAVACAARLRTRPRSTGANAAQTF